MDERNLDRLLSRRQKEPLPPLPMTFQQDVWREIRRRKSGAGEPQCAWFGSLLEPLFKRAMVLSALAFALVLGAALGAASVNSQNAETRLALDLQVFGKFSPALPSTLMELQK